VLSVWVEIEGYIEKGENYGREFGHSNIYRELLPFVSVVRLIEL